MGWKRPNHSSTRCARPAHRSSMQRLPHCPTQQASSSKPRGLPAHSLNLLQRRGGVQHHTRLAAQVLDLRAGRAWTLNLGVHAACAGKRDARCRCRRCRRRCCRRRRCCCCHVAAASLAGWSAVWSQSVTTRIEYTCPPKRLKPRRTHLVDQAVQVDGGALLGVDGDDVGARLLTASENRGCST